MHEIHQTNTHPNKVHWPFTLSFPSLFSGFLSHTLSSFHFVYQTSASQSQNCQFTFDENEHRHKFSVDTCREIKSSWKSIPFNADFCSLCFLFRFLFVKVANITTRHRSYSYTTLYSVYLRRKQRQKFVYHHKYLSFTWKLLYVPISR